MSVIHAPSGEFRHDHDNDRQSRHTSAHAVQEHALPCVFAALSFPVRHHAGLRHREREERTHSKERYQAICNAAEADEQSGRKDREHDDALRVDQPAAAIGKGTRKISIFCYEPADPRKICKRCIRRERQ